MQAEKEKAVYLQMDLFIRSFVPVTVEVEVLTVFIDNTLNQEQELLSSVLLNWVLCIYDTVCVTAQSAQCNKN